jgi:hypothetical protein|eukprot:gnl/Ergobibamus_cyprinoides/1333.p2 GENE.gnl/Ergobibamus_cyprinoides/1333~~gnl/Ergobibamus_cyprinoides/1333.p2  ORF type:complete len:205 (+),score=0.92 gnl/Ergobibamus_cyprinoides/1333:53-616(+)
MSQIPCGSQPSSPTPFATDRFSSRAKAALRAARSPAATPSRRAGRATGNTEHTPRGLYSPIYPRSFGTGSPLGARSPGSPSDCDRDRFAAFLEPSPAMSPPPIATAAAAISGTPPLLSNHVAGSTRPTAEPSIPSVRPTVGTKRPASGPLGPARPARRAILTDEPSSSPNPEFADDLCHVVPIRLEV